MISSFSFLARFAVLLAVWGVVSAQAQPVVNAVDAAVQEGLRRQEERLRQQQGATELSRPLSV